MKKIIILVLLIAACHKGWNDYRANKVAPEFNEPYLMVYGRDSCSVTQKTISELNKAGVIFHYQNIDNAEIADKLHSKMGSAGLTTRYYLLPVVDINNTISVRPNNAQLIHQAKALSL